MLLLLLESPRSFVTSGGRRNEARTGQSVETSWRVDGHWCNHGSEQPNVNPGSTFDISNDGTRLSVDACRAIIPWLGRGRGGPIRDGRRSRTVGTEGGRNTGRQVGGVLVSERITAGGHFLFLFLENIGGTEGGVGERRADRRAGIGVGTERGLLTGRQWGLDDLCLDNTQNLPDLTTNGGNDHGNLVKEITSIACASQIRVPLIRFGEIAFGTQVRPRDGEVFEGEVGTTSRAAGR